MNVVQEQTNSKAVGKVCVICGLWKSVEDYWPKVTSKDGYEHLCKACRKPSMPLIQHSLQDGLLGKVCATCQAWKPLSEFGYDAQKSDGLACRCKECNRQRARQYWQADPVAWGKRNSGCYYRHAEGRRQHAIDFRNAHLDEIRTYDRVRGPERYRKEPHKRTAYTHARRARVRKAEGRFTPTEWRDLCALYEYACVRCGRKHPEIKLSPDHVIPIALGGSNDITNIQPLCLKCNLSKATKTIDYRFN